MASNSKKYKKKIEFKEIIYIKHSIIEILEAIRDIIGPYL